MNRTKAREQAFKMIFEFSFGKHSAQSIIEAVKEDNTALIDDYSSAAVAGVELKQAEIDALIEKYSVGWSISRISTVTAALLRLAVYEIMYMQDIPVSVSINEAIELAKKYEGEECAAFINGILGSLEKNESVVKNATEEKQCSDI